MTIEIAMGTDSVGDVANLDLEELLATRLLVQGNSGSGKSHLLRRLLEMSAPWVQQVVIDPEGDFVTLADRFGHMAIDAADYSETEIAGLAARVREHRVSVVLNLEGLDVDAQLRCAGLFLNRLFDAPRDHWYPVLVVVDEAQLFAPAAAGEVGEESRRVSLGAMTNLMCRGRKRGLAGVIATQRLAKLAKNVAAEASNFLMGRTFLDIDMIRAADLLGMERRQAEQIRDLERGQFLALGPAVCRRPRLVRIGSVETGGRGGGPKLAPLPSFSADDRQSLLFRPPELDLAPPPPPPPVPAEALVLQMSVKATEAKSPIPAIEKTQEEADADVEAVLAEMAHDPSIAQRSPAELFHDFTVRCRMRGLALPPLDPAGFARRLSLARVGLYSESQIDDDLRQAFALADSLPDDMLAVFLLVALAARDGAPCPSDEEIARVYGTHSLNRARRLLTYMEGQNALVVRVDLRNRRTVAIPALGWTTTADAMAEG